MNGDSHGDTGPRFSSRATFAIKFGFPTGFLAIALISLSLSGNPKVGWLPAVFWSGGFVVVLWWTLPLKRVWLVDENFIIGNGLREIEVPRTALRRIEENQMGRSPTITLYFDPPTTLGRAVRILPPTDWLNGEAFDQAAGVLRELVLVNTAGREKELARRFRQETETAITGILADPSLDRVAEVTALSDGHLDGLIERLPAYSTLRDFALSERQRRWYG